MKDSTQRSADKAVDSIQQCLVSYASDLSFDALPSVTVHAAKVRIIDTLGALIGGYFGVPCRIARNLAVHMPNPTGATIIGTRCKTSPDMAAFANATTARYVEANDVYHWPGSTTGHPSDVMMPVLAAGEQMHASGRDFITGVVLAYEVCVRLSDVIRPSGFDASNFCCVGNAVAAGKLFGLTPEQLAHGIAMAVVPNNILRQVRTGHLSVWKAVAAGQAGRAGVFAAMLARAGMEGPHLPFEGKAGWCDHVAGRRFTLAAMGGNATPFKIQDTLIKQRSSCATTISSILAAEKIGALKNPGAVSKVTVEVSQQAKDGKATGEHHWNPDSKETADHSIPYVTAATLMDGTVTPHSFSDARLWNLDLRALLQKVEVVANDEFTRDYKKTPVIHRARITVVSRNGERLVGESGGDHGDLSDVKSDAQIEEKFRSLAEDTLGAKRVSALLVRLWNLEDAPDIAGIPTAFALD